MANQELKNTLTVQSQEMNRFDFREWITAKLPSNVVLNSDRVQKTEADIFNELEGTLTDFDCKKCRNKGFVYYMDGNELKSHKCDCLKTRDSLIRMKQSGLGKLLDRYTFDNFRTDTDFQAMIKNIALDFIENGDNFFFIGGQVGCGKSHICTAIVREYLLQGRSARYMQWRDDIVKLKANVNNPEYQDMINPFKKTEILYIDDLFKTERGKAPTPADINIAFELINQRYINDEITIISSERTLRDLLPVDEGFVSRIIEKCGDYMIEVAPDKHKNYRLRGII